MLDAEGENCGVSEAAWLIIRGKRSWLDLTELKLEYEERPVYSFLSLSWAAIADIDLNSEVLRCCGALRLEVWGVWRVLSLL